MPLPLLASLLAPFLGVAAPQQAPAESWRVYAGDYTMWSAMDALSVRREGPLAMFREVTAGLKGPLDGGGGRMFAYVVLDTVYDCAARTSRSTHGKFHDRAGKLLWEQDFDIPARSGANNSQFLHFEKAACRDGAPAPDPQGVPSIAAFLAWGAFDWMRAPEGAPARP